MILVEIENGAAEGFLFTSFHILEGAMLRIDAAGNVETIAIQ